MPYTLVYLQTINFIFALSTAVIYQYQINLWHDQAVIIFSAAGFFFSILTLITLLYGAMLKTEIRLATRALNLLICAFISFGQLSVLAFVLYQKVFGVMPPLPRLL